MYSEFYEQEFPKLYELLIFLIENAIPQDYEDEKILQSVKKFNNETIYKKIEQFLNNKNTIHHVKISDIDKSLPTKGIKKVVFQAKVANIKTKYSKKGKKYYLVSFIDKDNNTIDLLHIPNNGHWLTRTEIAINYKIQK